MAKMSFLSRSIRSAIAVGVGSALLAAPGFAQETAADAQAEDNAERIIVTGSRIARPELSQSAPLVTLDEDDIARFGQVDLGQILAELPAVGAGSTLIGNRENNASAGVSSADLRNLGAQRTLVLVNGKRHVAGQPGSASVDLSTIPASLIQRVEIMTGGASAVYGSDAVSGVINVILKNDYSGFEVRATGSGSTEGVGAKTHEFSFLGGGDIAEGRGNLTVFGGINRIQETMEFDVRQFDDWGTVVNPANTERGDGIPDRLWVPRVGSDLVAGSGVLFGSTTDIYSGFLPDGTPVDQPARGGFNSAAFHEFPEGCDTCHFGSDYINLQPEVQRFNVGATMNYNLTDNASFYTDVKFVKADIQQQFQPSFRFGNAVINIADNAFLDEGLRADLLGQGVGFAALGKFFEDLGNRSAENRRQTFRTVMGVNGFIDYASTSLEYDFYYSYGETENRRKTLNDIISGNVDAALDSVIDPTTGEAVCRDLTAGSVNPGSCAPYNPFGVGVASPESIAFLSADVTREDKIVQEYVGASFVTDTAGWLELPGGPVDFAFGFEYREESSETITDEFTKKGFLDGAATPDSFGEYDVTESFFELNLPILAGMPFAEELSVDLAYRTADYSHAGNADAWKVGFMWAPVEDVRLRGTYGVAVRAPNITEAFDPRSPGFVNITDPCDENNISNDPARAGNCQLLGFPATGFASETNVSVDLIESGNPDLFSEESDSYTVGVVWTPSFIENFSTTLDMYDITIEDAIRFTAPQDIINNCVDSEGGLADEYCSLVTRDPANNNNISIVESTYLNSAALETRGYEWDTNYVFALEDYDLPGSVATNFFVNYLDKLTQFNFQDRPDQENILRGALGTPKLQARLSANYLINDYNINWTTRYVDRSSTFNPTPRLNAFEATDRPYVGSIVTHDLNLGWDVTENFNARVGVRNVFDKVPPGITGNSLYDLIGRRAYVNLVYTF